MHTDGARVGAIFCFSRDPPIRPEIGPHSKDNCQRFWRRLQRASRLPSLAECRSQIGLVHPQGDVFLFLLALRYISDSSKYVKHRNTNTNQDSARM